VRSVITFGIDSPFETAKSPKGYEVVRTAGLTKTIHQRSKNQDFNFSCSPDGLVVPGSGGTIPVGGGGNS